MEKNLIIFGAKYLIFLLCLIFAGYFIKQERQKQKQILIFGIITLPLTYVVAKILGHFYYDPRPFVVGNFTPLLAHVADNGFPSDHTLLSSSLAAITYFFDKKTGVLLFVLAFIVGVCRVLAGVHHMIDIIGAILIAIATMWVVGKYCYPKLMLRIK